MTRTVKSVLSIVVSLLMVVALFAGCGGDPAPASTDAQNPSAAAKDPSEIKIGYIVKCLSNTFWQTYEAGARAAAEDLGVQIDVRDVPTETDLSAQLDVALAMVGQDYDAIVAASISNTNLIPAIAKANEAGIPWIVVSEAQDEDVLKQSNAHITAECRLSFYQEGVVAGQYVVEQLGGKGQVAIVEGLAGTSATRDRVQGFTDALKDSEIEIVASQPADWAREEAHDVAAAMLQANGDIQAIYALNDTMALGVATAVEQAGKDGQILVIGDDGTQEAFAAIQNGSMAATIDGVAYQIAYYSVCAAVKAIYEGEDAVEDYSLTPALVCADNVQEAISEAPKPVKEMFEINKNIYLPIEGFDAE